MLPMRRYNQGWIPSLFDDLFATDFVNKTNATAPAINVVEDDRSYQVEVAAPGMAKGDFQIHVDDESNLVIKMEKAQEKNNEKKNQRYLRREFSYTKYQQTLILPDDVDKKGIAAAVENGVLTVTLPKLTAEQKQQTLQHIEVK